VAAPPDSLAALGRGEREGVDEKGGQESGGNGQGRHGEEVRGVEKERREERREGMCPHLWVKVMPVAVSNMRWRLLTANFLELLFESNSPYCNFRH